MQEMPDTTARIERSNESGGVYDPHSEVQDVGIHQGRVAQSGSEERDSGQDINDGKSGHPSALVIKVLRSGHTGQEGLQPAVEGKDRDIPNPCREDLRRAGGEVLPRKQNLQQDMDVRSSEDKKYGRESRLNRQK